MKEQKIYKGSADNAKIITSIGKYNPPDLVAFGGPSRKPHFFVRSTPMTSTTCKIFLYLAVPKQNLSILQAIRRAILTPVWSFHLVQSSVFDGDSVFIRGQARRMKSAEEEEKKTWNSQVFVPAKSDVVVVAFRRYSADQS